MWRLGSRTRLDFTLVEIRTVEAATGTSWWRLDPCGDLGHAKAVLGLELSDTEIGTMTVGELERRFRPADGDDLPTEFDNGIPIDGRTFDEYVVWGAYRFRWAPDVVERQTIRNLRLIADSDPGDDDG